MTVYLTLCALHRHPSLVKSSRLQPFFLSMLPQFPFSPVFTWSRRISSLLSLFSAKHISCCFFFLRSSSISVPFFQVTKRMHTRAHHITNTDTQCLTEDLMVMMLFVAKTEPSCLGSHPLSSGQPLIPLPSLFSRPAHIYLSSLPFCVFD